MVKIKRLEELPEGFVAATLCFAVLVAFEGQLVGETLKLRDTLLVGLLAFRNVSVVWRFLSATLLRVL